MKHLAYLRKKCFTASQTAEILNLVVFPAITYRMGVIVFPDEYISKWDKQARNLMAHKLRTSQALGTIHWHLQNKYGGYNLFQLKDLQLINTAAVYLNYAANTKYTDKFAHLISMECFLGENTHLQEVQNKLEKLKLQIVYNPAFGR